MAIYNKIGWLNDQTPAINATNLNHMDEGIYDASRRVQALAMGETYNGTFTPTAPDEYPDGVDQGDSYYVSGVSVSGYAFTAGELTGETANNGDKLVYNGTQWTMVEYIDTVAHTDTIANLLEVDYNINTVVVVDGYSEQNDGGGGVFNWNSTADKATANGKNIFDPSVSLANQGTGVGTGCWVKIGDGYALEGVESLIGFDPQVSGIVQEIDGYYARGDGGGGTFIFDTTVDKSTANGGTIFDPSVSLANQGTGSGIGCWVRQYSGAINIMWFGAYNDNTNPTETTAAINASIGTLEKTIFFPSGTYSVNSTIQVNKGQVIQGCHGGRFSTNLSKIVMTLGDTLVFDQSLSTSSGAEDCMSCNDMYIEADKCIRLNDETILIEDGGLSPYLMRGEFRRNTFAAITQNTGYGIFASKMFDSIIEHNEFRLHARELVLQGCDINKIVTNRIWSFGEYGILDLGIGTFGSQNLIENNDILNAGENGTFIKTTSRHIRIKDNYLEKPLDSSGCKGFIDASLVDTPTFGDNPVSVSLGLSTVITENRLDGQSEATDFIYKIDPTRMISVIIEDSLTSGDGATEWIEVVDDYLPIMINSTKTNDFRLRGGVDSDRRFNKFETKKIQYKADSIIIDSESLVSMDRSNLASENSYQHVFLDTNGIIIKPTLGTLIARFVLPNVGTLVNPWMKSGESWEVSIMARTISGTDTIDILILKDGLGSGNVSTSLTTQNTNIVIPFTAGTVSESMGIGIRRLNTPVEDVLIQSIEFRKA